MTADPRNTIRDKVAEAIRRARGHAHPGLRYSEYLADAAIAAHLEALDEANTIESVEQLDALPVNSVLLDGDGDIYVVGDLNVVNLCAGDSPYARFEPPTLSARVLYRPGETP